MSHSYFIFYQTCDSVFKQSKNFVIILLDGNKCWRARSNRQRTKDNEGKKINSAWFRRLGYNTNWNNPIYVHFCCLKWFVKFCLCVRTFMHNSAELELHKLLSRCVCVANWIRSSHCERSTRRWFFDCWHLMHV